jgi:hypothetical protein
MGYDMSGFFTGCHIDRFEEKLSISSIGSVSGHDREKIAVWKAKIKLM